MYIVPNIALCYNHNEILYEEVTVMPASKAQQKAVSKYMKANYDEIKVRVPKGQKELIQAHAESMGESVNGFIGRAIAEAMERDKSK